MRGSESCRTANNRRGEDMLRDIEMLATRVSLYHKAYKYPKEEIDDMWEAVLLCQFHDCLPGSSIEMCYDDSDEVTFQPILLVCCDVTQLTLSIAI